MLKRCALPVVLAFLGTSSAIAQPPAPLPACPVNWDWIQDGTVTFPVTDDEAAPRGAVATVECTIAASQHPAHCRILSQTRGSSMGLIAQETAEAYKAKALDQSNRSTVGRIVRMSFEKISDRAADTDYHHEIILLEIATNCP
ncbi:MAG TPA: hypothetical protein VGL66_11535 [Caulobacteraceae bacterium]|jgi:hypothetical protein